MGWTSRTRRLTCSRGLRGVWLAALCCGAGWLARPWAVWGLPHGAAAPWAGLGPPFPLGSGSCAMGPLGGLMAGLGFGFGPLVRASWGRWAASWLGWCFGAMGPLGGLMAGLVFWFVPLGPGLQDRRGQAGGGQTQRRHRGLQGTRYARSSMRSCSCVPPLAWVSSAVAYASPYHRDEIIVTLIGCLSRPCRDCGRRLVDRHCAV